VFHARDNQNMYVVVLQPGRVILVIDCSREYQRQSMRKSRNNIAASVKDDNDVTDAKVPYHIYTIIIDCAPITFVDSMGTRALYQVIVHCKVYVFACIVIYYLYAYIFYILMLCHVLIVSFCT